MFNLDNFDASEYKQESEVIPEGLYTCILESTETKQTKDGTGAYLKCQYSILDGDFKDRKFWDNLNLLNKNKEAENIAKARLASIVKACGLSGLKGENEIPLLYNKPLLIKLKVKDNGEYGMQNNIASIKAPVGQTSQNKPKPMKGFEVDEVEKPVEKNKTAPKKSADPFSDIDEDDIPY